MHPVIDLYEVGGATDCADSADSADFADTAPAHPGESSAVPPTEVSAVESPKLTKLPFTLFKQ